MKQNDRYQLRGVSAQKEDVHQAIQNLDFGLFPKAFCKIYPDYWAGDPQWCNIMHADGAGTKSVLAYLYWKETGDLSVWKGIAMDAIVMNLDDMLCVGALGPFTYSSTIGRNKQLIPGEVIREIIQGTQSYFQELAEFGIELTLMGGETADLGDVVRTVIVDGTMACRMLRKELITTENLKEGDVIVSLSSSGQLSYEKEYNSGIGSNGLTSARHELLSKRYAQEFPESVDPSLPEEVVYNGNYQMTDTPGTPLNIGKMLLSPTRTYAPVLKKILERYRERLHGIIHCSGGGQTKCLHYLPRPMRLIKNQLLPIPPVFHLIQESASTPWKEMYQVFNMGQRMEIFTDRVTAEAIVEICAAFQLEARISGHVETSHRKELIIESPWGSWTYTHKD